MTYAPVSGQMRLLVFAREPVLGQVKTRLAAAVGPEAALAVYRELLALTAAAVAAAGVPATLWLAAAPASGASPTADSAPDRPEWPGLAWRVQPPLASLGARMALAFTDAFAAGADRVVVIGTDCPGLRPELLREAFALLSGHDLVLGPAVDGGYYLLGMKQLQPDLFADKQWSTATVLTDTLADAGRLGLRVAQLPVLRDVDTVEDLAAWRGEAVGRRE